MKEAEEEREEGTIMARDLAQTVREWGAPRVGVVGDLMLDEYVWGEVERISPEAPIPVLRVSRREVRAGGAGSVVTDVARLGGEVTVFSVLGQDAAGERVSEMFHVEGCRLDGVYFDARRRTTLKSRHIGYVQHADRAVQQILRVDEEDKVPISAEAREVILSALRERAEELDIILVSDYHKGLIDKAFITALAAAAGDVPILVDPSRVSDYSIYRGVRMMCPNRYEAELATGIACRDVDGAREAADALIERLDLEAAVVTLDREGMFVATRDGEARHVPTRARTVADVTGAGDMVLSVFGVARAAGCDWFESAQLANVAAGIEVRHIGVTPVSREELVQELLWDGHLAADKLKTPSELATIAAEAKRAGRTIVFTNGCFDLLHRGHHEVLYGAKRLGDILIVAINSDASVKRLKGPTRPSIPQDGRVRMLAGLAFVDYVTVFDEDTPNHLLELLRPDVLVKGSEYRERTEGVVGREIVEAYGGRIAYVEQVPGWSTTSLLGDREK
ncbi:MAG TPA: bifunctional heptose 7-phosphate kinase/heptose 1-phosphate adenyltransferase [Planctomycetota bacterium]|nr:bifunctional heptose 7-phosphate kinase/heptose 1-phosphate adenyltransferase [Planctomycetota bacterium]